VCLHVEHDELLCFNRTARRETCCPCILETSCPSVLVLGACVLVLGGVPLQRCTTGSKERRGFSPCLGFSWSSVSAAVAFGWSSTSAALAFWVKQRFSAAVRALLLSGALAPEVRHGFSRAPKGH
jgi:hypothetical protein